jgi:hypothetical protein
LCDDFEAALHEAFPHPRFHLDVLHIDHHPQYLPRYSLSIPVLLAENSDTLICETFFQAAALHAWLAAP